MNDQSTDDGATDVTYTVRSGDTLSGIAFAFYGDAEQAERIYQSNLGRMQPDGRQFNRHGLILPGWTLLIPQPTQGIVEERDGARWYVVKRGDSLRGIAAQVLGDEEHYRDLFDLNVGVARVGDAGPVLRRADLIWPGLRLRLPDDPASNDVSAPPPESPASTAASPAPRLDSPVVAEIPPTQMRTRSEATEAPVAPTPIYTPAPAPTAVPTVASTPATAVPNSAAARSAYLSPGEAAVAGGAAAAALRGPAARQVFHAQVRDREPQLAGTCGLVHQFVRVAVSDIRDGLQSAKKQ